MRVYKFLSADYALQDIYERKIKLSAFEDMNDPFELLGSRWSDTGVDTILTSHAAATYGALCFSTNWSNPLLWSHYADKHKGMCLGFDIPDRSDSVQTPIYVDGPEMQDPGILFEALRHRNFWIAEAPIMRKLLLKYKGWRYEDEVRLFARLDGKNGQLSYFDFGENLTLREVILGVRCIVSGNEVEERLRTYPSPVKTLKAKLSFESFQVVEDPNALAGQAERVRRSERV
jgi:hypothetical protein